MLGAATDSNERAADLATERYVSGLNDFLNVLDAQRNLFQMQSDLAQSDAAVSTGLVALR